MSYAKAVVGNYNTLYKVEYMKGLTIEPTITIPDCGASYSPIAIVQAMPPAEDMEEPEPTPYNAGEYINCELYDYDYSPILALTNCTLPPMLYEEYMVMGIHFDKPYYIQMKMIN